MTDACETVRPIARNDCSPTEMVRRARSDGARVGDLISMLQVSESTYYRWRKNFGGLSVDQAKRLLHASNYESQIKSLTRTVIDASKSARQLEHEVGRLRRRVNALNKERQKQAPNHGTGPADAFAENRRLRDLERDILYFAIRFTQGAIPLCKLIEDLQEQTSAADLEQLYKLAFDPKRHLRQRAIVVIFCLYGISSAMTAEIAGVYHRTVKKYARRFRLSGFVGLIPPRKATPKASDEEYRRAIFTILHAPPSEYGFNRTTWRRKDIHSVMAKKGMLIGHNNIDTIIKNSGYRFLKARRVLTSNDPDYRKKVDRIKHILGNLKRTERFFSIDEFGPFAIKEQGGRRLVGPGERPTVPQFQHSKGCLIVTAALELSRNQITHFYSSGKNTQEMIRLLGVLLREYRDCTKLYLSWDAAGWHASKTFNKQLAAVNQSSFRRKNRTPAVEAAPLPARAQFMNVIESVFSGLAVSIVHNSDYTSVGDAKVAIDRYFRDRNLFFQEHPKRAGKKIWGTERVEAAFDESHNCKSARFR